ncbi:MAG: DUF1015 domain-containing protein [Candidatus Aminicenantes bacterium]|nr:DUF1015 domain-containing protein [Candidatus Aminicenantes bacterium]
MARIEPFRGLRPRKDLAEKIAAPPYDVLSSEEARELVKDNSFSFLHIGKPEIDLPPGTDLYADEVYAKGKENFDRFIRNGILCQDDQKCFYIYKQVWGEHVQIGLVAGASCQDYQDDVIKKHELTREDKERDRQRHIETLNAQTGPVFLTYKQKASIDHLIEQGMARGPENDFSTYDGVRHIFYVVEEKKLVATIQEEFRKLDVLYVADGHHRSAAATQIKIKSQQGNAGHSGDEEYNFFLAVIFPHNQMKILPYNRVVRDLNGMDHADFMARVSERFTCEPTLEKVPAGAQEFCMYVTGQWYRLRAKPGTFDRADAIASLDVSILQDNLLAPVLGIRDPRTDKRIDFVGGIRGTGELERKVDSGGFAVAFSFRATTIEQLFAVADAGKIMPPKSTWFEPKLKDGLVSHLLD